jgi:hypothetical protein
MKQIILLLFFILVSIYQTFSQKTKCKNNSIKQFTLVNKDSSLYSIIDSCNCKSKLYKYDSFEILEMHLDYPCRIEYTLEGLDSTCSKLEFRSLNNILDLQSIYYEKCLNKGIKYLPGFIKNEIYNKGVNLMFHLYFINESLNSLKTNMHRYEIIYNIKLNKVISCNLKFY